MYFTVSPKGPRHAKESEVATAVLNYFWSEHANELVALAVKHFLADTEPTREEIAAIVNPKE